MPITVEHRVDRLLQESVKGKEDPKLEESPFQRATVFAHSFLLLFLDEQVVGKQFADRTELITTLQKWKKFATESGLDREQLKDEWDDLVILNGNVVVNSNSPGGPFIAGHIRG